MSTARELAAYLQAELTGDSEVEVHDVSSLDAAQAGDAVFVTDAKRLAEAEQTAAAIVVAPRTLSSSHKTLLKVDDPRVSFSKLVDRFRPVERPLPGIHASAVVSREARVAKTASVGALAVIEAGATIGENAVVGPGCHVAARASVGDGTVLVSRVFLGADCAWGARGIAHAGVVIGADGFGFATGADGKHHKVRQLGNVVIGDDVEIGANSTVDRGTFGSTEIGDGTKVDNLVHVAHNCRIGKNVLLAAQVGISGSCEIGDNAILLGQSGLKDHLKIGARAVIMPQSGIAKDVPAGVAMFGSPAFTRMQRERHLAAVMKLPELLKRVKALEAKSKGH